MNFRSIVNQIAEDQIEDAIQVFDFFFNNISEIKNELVLLQGSYNSLKNQETNLTIKRSDLIVEKSQLRKSILSLYTRIESLVEEKPIDSKNPPKNLSSKSQAIVKIVQNAVKDKDYEIISQIHSDQSSYYFKARKNSLVKNDYYVIQVLNWYKLNNSAKSYNQKYLDFFSGCPDPFVDLLEFEPGNPSFIIRKYINGVVLNDLIKQGVKLSLLRTLDVIIDLSKGLQQSDKENVFYNNLIPDEIIIDRKGEIYILPLNIFEDNINIVTWKNLKDGIKFMSPEQLVLAGNKAEQNKLTNLSSQYSLALLLFYIFMGEPLFDGKGLSSLFLDRIDREDTKSQLKDLYKSIKTKLLQFLIEEQKAEELLNEFILIFERLLQDDPNERFLDFDDFISQIVFWKLQVEKEQKSSEGKKIYFVSSSFERSIVMNENMIDEFYEDLVAQLPSKKSMEKDNNRNIRFQFAFNYLFTSIANLENESYLEEALSSLVKSLHADFTIEDYEAYFKLLKENITKNDSDWNDKIEEAWKYFMEQSLNAIDTILKPTENFKGHFNH